MPAPILVTPTPSFDECPSCPSFDEAFAVPWGEPPPLPSAACLSCMAGKTLSDWCNELVQLVHPHPECEGIINI